MDEKNKRIMKPSFDEVNRIDHSLHCLAAYEVTNGKMVIPKSMEEMANLSIKIANKFNYFKDLIRKGECTFDFIKTTVLAKNGPFLQDKNIDISDPKYFEEPIAAEPTDEPNDVVQSFIQKLMNSASELKVEVLPMSSIPEIPKTEKTEKTENPKALPVKKENRKKRKSKKH